MDLTKESFMIVRIAVCHRKKLWGGLDLFAGGESQVGNIGPCARLCWSDGMTNKCGRIFARKLYNFLPLKKYSF